MAPDDEDNPLQRWIDAEQRWGDPEGGFGNAPPEETASTADTPESELPVDAPGEEGESIDVDSRTSRYFWSAVVLANVAVGTSSLGLMLIGFRGQWTLGGALVVVGVLAGLRTYRTYREFRRGDGEEA